MQIVILGSDGFVGKNLVDYFKKKYLLTCFDISSDNFNKFHGVFFKKKNILDLREIDLPNSNFIVINVGALLGSKDFRENYINNVETVKKLIKVLKNKKNFKGLIHFSSISAQRRISFYGITKYLSEKIVRNSCLPHIILQSEMIIGVGARSVEKLKKISKFFPFFIPVPNGGKVIRYPINIKQVIKITNDIIKKKNFNNKTYSLVSEKVLFRNFLKKILNKKIIKIPTLFLLVISRILENLFKNPLFTYDNAYGVSSSTKLNHPKYMLKY